MKNKIAKLFGMLTLVLSICINLTSCDHGTYHIYPAGKNGSGNNVGTNAYSNTGYSSTGSSEMMAVFKTSKNIGRPIKLKVKISAEKTSSLATLNYYPVSDGTKSANVYCYDDFKIIDSPKISFTGEGNSSSWTSPTQSVDFKLHIESDIPPLADLPIYFDGVHLGDLKGFTTTAEFTIKGSTKFFFTNYTSRSYTYNTYREENKRIEGEGVGQPGEASTSIEIIEHRHKIDIVGSLINAQSIKSVDIALNNKNITEEFPLLIGESNIPLENISLEFSFTPSTAFSGRATICDTNDCCNEKMTESDTPATISYESKNSAAASWNIYYVTEKEPILMVPTSIILEEESTEMSGNDTETDMES